MDIQQFQNNRAQYPPEELVKHAGKYVAWSPDGKQIIATAERLTDLAAAVKTSGYDPKNCVLSSVPFPDEMILGGVHPA